MSYCLSLSVAAFIAGSTEGLLAIWVMLGFMPVIVPAVDKAHAVFLYVMLTVHLVVAILTMMFARAIAIAGWSSIRPRKTARPKDIEWLDAWFMGSGLLLFLASIVVPMLIAAIVMISPWMGIIAMAAIGVAVKGMVGWSNANRILGSLNLKVNYWPWPNGLIGTVTMVSLYVYLAPMTIDMIENGIGRAEAMQLSTLDRLTTEGERMALLSPRMAQLYELKLSAEQALEKQEADATARGASSNAAVLAARVKAIDAQIALLTSANQLQGAIVTNAKEVDNVRQLLLALRSVAPALHK